MSELQSEKISAIYCGASHSLGLTATGAIYCWGKNSQGQCGLGTEFSSEIMQISVLTAYISSNKICHIHLGHTDDVLKPTKVNMLGVKKVSQVG